MPFFTDVLPALAFALVVAGCAFVWWRRRQARKYDLNRLFDEDETPPESEYDELVTDDSGPYCHSCDTPYPAGTRQCPRCRRPL